MPVGLSLVGQNCCLGSNLPFPKHLPQLSDKSSASLPSERLLVLTAMPTSIAFWGWLYKWPVKELNFYLTQVETGGAARQFVIQKHKEAMIAPFYGV